MKKILSIVCLACFAVALGASVGCEEKKSTSGPSNSGTGKASPSPAGSATKSGS